MNNRKTVVIADSHLGVKDNDIALICSFISNLRPINTELLFLGDLFHIWAGPRKFHTAQITRFLQLLQSFRNQGGMCYLVTGNRDVFIRENNTDLPFDKIATDALILEKSAGKLMAVHGDTVNSKDSQYLKWRKMIRHPLFQFPFRMIPSRQAKKIMFLFERKLKQTNTAFRQVFPTEEWKQFLETVSSTHSPVLLLAGHFHPSTLIKHNIGSTTGLVLPDWCDNHYYLEIEESLVFQEKYFS